MASNDPTANIQQYIVIFCEPFPFQLMTINSRMHTYTTPPPPPPCTHTPVHVHARTHAHACARARTHIKIKLASHIYSSCMRVSALEYTHMQLFPGPRRCYNYI